MPRRLFLVLACSARPIGLTGLTGQIVRSPIRSFRFQGFHRGGVGAGFRYVSYRIGLLRYPDCLLQARLGLRIGALFCQTDCKWDYKQYA